MSLFNYQQHEEESATKLLISELNRKFESTAAAANFVGLKKGTSIGLACYDKNKTAGGYHWTYYEEK